MRNEGIQTEIGKIELLFNFVCCIHQVPDPWPILDLVKFKVHSTSPAMSRHDITFLRYQAKLTLFVKTLLYVSSGLL